MLLSKEYNSGISVGYDFENVRNFENHSCSEVERVSVKLWELDFLCIQSTIPIQMHLSENYSTYCLFTKIQTQIKSISKHLVPG